MSKRTAIGIDLGTTYSCVAIFRNNKVEILPNDQGNRTTPSYVAFTEDDRLVGDGAYNQAAMNPRNTIFGAKRLLGRDFKDKTVKDDIKLLPYKVVNKGNRPYIEVDAFGDLKQFSAEQVGSMILGKMKEAAEAALDRPVTDAVITVPAYFNDAQRQATKDAATIARLNVLRIINEPTAAAIAYGLNKLDDDNDNDFMKKSTATGLALQGGKVGGKNILVYDLGGGTFDVSVLNIKEGVFTVLATDGDTHLGVQIDSLVHGRNLNSSITRAKFESLCSDLFQATLQTVKDVLREANLEKWAINEIVLVGGSTRIPKIQDLVTSFFDGRKPSKSIHPDEAVAYGAAVQASILIKDSSSTVTNDIHLQDVNSLSLGITLHSGLMSFIIPRNTPLPVTVTKEYFTVFDYQESIDLSVYEGERKLGKDNHLVGRFVLYNITLAPEATVAVAYTMSLDRNGILKVSAVDTGNGSRGSETIKNDNNRLSKEQIQQMIREAGEYRERDEEESRRVEARNDLERYVYSVESAFERHGSKLSPAKRNFVEEELNGMTAWLDNTRKGSIEEYQYNLDIFKQSVDRIISPYLNLY
ncbi:heat shock protein 70 [Scheffersomyces coipomensis]|uniref:heat shock protein 70 n=1 Tax=Scheffersomyces coipomensis TaxID=1788519 RepID=UPI00315CE753